MERVPPLMDAEWHGDTVRITEGVLLLVATACLLPFLALGYLLLFSDLLTFFTEGPGASVHVPFTGDIAAWEWLTAGGTVGLGGLWAVLLIPTERQTPSVTRLLGFALLCGLAAAVGAVLLVGPGEFVPDSWEGIAWPVGVGVPVVLAVRRLPRLWRRAFG